MTSTSIPGGRLVDVFPPGFDSKSSSSCGYYNFTPSQLYQKLTEEYAPEKHIESTLVKSLWYGKQKKAARHEFILILVEDTQASLKNYIVLDRNVSNPDSTPSIGDSQPKRGINLLHTTALDAFRVSYDGIEEQLLRECKLDERDYLEKIEPESTEPLLLYQLVTLARLVSEMSPNYSIGAENCYWFGGLIWECLRILRPKANYDGRVVQERGRFGKIRFKVDREQKEEICDTFQQEIRWVEKRLDYDKQLFSMGLCLNGLPGLARKLVPSFSNAISDIPSNGRDYHAFTPEQLYRTLACRYDPAMHIERTLVRSVRHGKKRNGVPHEFLLIEVEDTQARLTNYFILDRDNHDYFPHSDGAALDSFRVSYDGREKQLLEDCQLKPFQRLKGAELSATEPLYLYQLVTLARVVSDKCPIYPGKTENCSRFVRLIWECLCLFRPNASYDDRSAEPRGIFSVFRYAPGEKDRELIWNAFTEEMHLVENRLSAGKDWQQWKISKTENSSLETLASIELPQRRGST